MLRYAVGGLEPNENDRKEVMRVNGVNYLLSEKFKSKLLANIVDWGTFLEIYHDKIDNEIMLNQIIKLLDIKDNNNLREVMIPLLRKIYYLPTTAHIGCMMKQFMIYEPLSVAVHELFTTLKHHYEDLVKIFVQLRNEYIIKNSLPDKLNDFDSQFAIWSEINEQEELESSSIILLLFNGKKGIHFTLSSGEVSKQCHILKKACQAFHYPGFCPKVPYKRLNLLLKFPVNEFTKTIKMLNPNIVLPQYNVMEKEIQQALNNPPPKPRIHDKFAREEPPKNLLAKLSKLKKMNADYAAINDAELHIIQWYVTKILELRKSLLNDGKLYESYFIESAKQINVVTDIIKRHLRDMPVY